MASRYSDSVNCDICGGKRSVGNHGGCSKIRQQRNAQVNLKQAALTERRAKKLSAGEA
jgi:ribosomal protein L28